MTETEAGMVVFEFACFVALVAFLVWAITKGGK